MFLLSREMVASDISALKAVIDVDKERIALEKWAEELATRDDDGIFLTLFDIGYNYKVSIKQYGIYTTKYGLLTF